MKRWIGFLLALCLLCGSAVAEYETLDKNSSGEAVLAARLELFRLGYYSKKPTEKSYNSKMGKVVEQFEADFDLPVDGVLSPEDQEVLYSAEPRIRLAKPTLKAQTNFEAKTEGRDTWSTVTLTWKVIENAEEYRILRSEEKNGTFEELAVVTEATYVDEKPPVGQVYYKIKAVGKNTAGGESAVVSAKVAAPYHEPECPLEIADISLKFNYIGEPLLRLKIRNASREKSIDYFSFHVEFFDHDGNRLSYYNTGKNWGNDFEWSVTTLKPKALWSTERLRWTCHGFTYAGMGSLDITITSIHLTDGSWIYPTGEEQKTYTFMKSEYEKRK